MSDPTGNGSRVERVAEGARTDAAKDAISRLRTRLLDLSNKNKLLNFKHSERARTHVRLIDELPNQLMAKLEADQALTFRALPEPEDEPRDEQSDDFLMALEEARVTDQTYLTEIGKLDGDDPSSKRVQQVERDLKDRVREQLGMGPRAHTDVLSIPDYARRHGFNPSYDLPEPDGAPPERHVDNQLQTLLLPDQMIRKLSSVYQDARTALQEMGVNTLYVAFGFLEWTESDTAKRPQQAPLLLHPVEMRRKLERGQYRFEIASTGEETAVNITLAEKLAKDHGLRLPDYDDDQDTPEAYFERVQEQILSAKSGWKLRRYVTVGHFAFARLVMYRDLDPAAWPEDRPLHTHAALSALLGGSEADFGTSAAPYPVDEPEIARKIPLTIADADSSQTSALVDVMDGKNLAIEGPPGTGKSQTITNIIGAAMASGKRVLFVAEKMAALEVVKSRLDAFGLGDFALELHSTKARKRDVLDSLAARIELQNQLSEPREHAEARRALEDLRTRLTRYADLLNTRFGALDMTVQQILWADQRAHETGDLPDELGRARLPGCTEITQYRAQEHKQLLGTIAEHIHDFDQQYGAVTAHPWYGCDLCEIGPFDRDSVLGALADWRSHLETLRAELDVPGLTETLADARRLITSAPDLPDSAGDPELLTRLAAPQDAAAAVDLMADLRRWRDVHHRLAEVSRAPRELPNALDELDRLIFTAAGSRRPDGAAQPTTVGELPDAAEATSTRAQTWRDHARFAGQLAGTLQLEDPITPRQLKPVVRAVQKVAQTSRDTLRLRTPALTDETATDRLTQARKRCGDLAWARDEMKRLFDLPDPDRADNGALRRHAQALRETGMFAGMKGSVRAAKKAYKAMARDKSTPRRPDMARHLDDMADLLESIRALNQDGALRQLCGDQFTGIDTDFEPLLAVSQFADDVRQAFAGIDPELRNTRRLLLSGDMSDLDGLASVADDPRFTALADDLAEITDPDHPLEAHAADLQGSGNRLQNAAEISQQLAITPSLPLDHLQWLRDRAAGWASARDTTLAHASVREILQDAGYLDALDPEGDHSALETAIETARTLHALDLPEGVRQHLFDPAYADRQEALKTAATRIEPRLAEVDGSLQAASQTAALDIPTFLGGDPEQAPLSDQLARIARAEADPAALSTWSTYNAATRDARAAGLDDILDAYRRAGRQPERVDLAYDRVLYRSLAASAYEAYPDLKRFSGVSQEQARASFRDIDRRLIDLDRQMLAAQLAREDVPRGNADGYPKDKTELALIRWEQRKEKRHIPIRELLARAGRAVQQLKPCFMMSPLSVAQYLKPGGLEFDLVVIDEASQMKPEDALSALARGSQVVVVGDPKQLPPTSFFDRMESTPEDEDSDTATDAQDVESILEMAMRCWQPYRRLLWHYRSRHASLIAFSNEKFYSRDLIVFPAPVRDDPRYGVHSEFVGGACRKGGTNLDEARRVAEAAVDFMRTEPDRSLGVVAMNKAQTDLIREEVSRLVARDPDAQRYTDAWDAHQGGLEHFFVKNLENVQGDERDVIYISTTYGPDPDSGVVQQKFGPINTQNGYRRLNVLFTRAKEKVKLFTSLQAHDVKVADESVTLGRRALRDYLEYAATGRLHGGHADHGAPDSDFEEVVKRRLEARGFDVDCQVGVAGYFIDLAVSHPAFPHGYVAGIECDGATYHSAMSARDRDRLRQDVLENLGWDIYRIWSTDWYRDPDGETDALCRHLTDLLRRKAPDQGRAGEAGTASEAPEESGRVVSLSHRSRSG